MDRLIGIHAVREALVAGRPLERIVIARGRHGNRFEELIDLARQRGVSVRFEDRAQIDRLAGSGQHQGVVALSAAKQAADLEDLIARGAVCENGKGFLVLLDGVEDPRNLGAILRTAETAGVHGVVIPERRAAGLTESVAKSSAGALEYVPVVKVVNIVHTLDEFKRAGLWVAGAEAGGDRLYWDADFIGPTVLVGGGEDRGVRRLVRERCDYIVSLPLKGRISSLNVSVAAGILLYEARRQRA